MSTADWEKTAIGVLIGVSILTILLIYFNIEPSVSVCVCECAPGYRAVACPTG